MYTSGIDYFAYEPGIMKEAYCNLCDAKMNVERNVDGPTSSVEAMSGGKHLHDLFTCPNTEEEWHEHAIELMDEMGETASKRIKKILQEEIDEILKNRAI